MEADELLTPEEAASILSDEVPELDEMALFNMRRSGRGPVWLRTEEGIRYPKAELIVWVVRVRVLANLAAEL